MGARVRVFVVEDSSLIRKRIIDNVKGLGNFDVVGFAESEQEAIDAIVRTQPDVVVTDIRLKEGSGIEVVRRLRQELNSSTPKIYVLTNYAYPEYKRQCSLVGADGFFDKSAEYDSFLTALRADALTPARSAWTLMPRIDFASSTQIRPPSLARRLRNGYRVLREVEFPAIF